MVAATNFGDDVDFLQRHTETVVLSADGGAARVALCPALQGRVATSTTGGGAGPSFGWLNRALIASGRLVPHMNVYGGEDQRLRVTFRAEQDEVLAFGHLGEPYFRAEWGRNVVGMLLDDATDWDELRELLTDSYCLQAPRRLAALVTRPSAQDTDADSPG